MLKLKNLALYTLVLFPIASIAQAPAPSTAQTEVVNDHHADEAAIQQVMNRYHAAIQAHDGAALSSLFLPDAKKSGDVRRDIDASDLLRALIGVSFVSSGGDWQQSAKRLVEILIAGSRPAE